MHVKIVGNIQLEKPISWKERCLKLLQWLKIPFLVFVFISTGTLNTILAKFQNESWASVDNDIKPPRLYIHPFTQTWTLFFGNTLVSLPVYWIKSAFSKRKNVFGQTIRKETLNPLWFLLPATFYFLACNVLHIALVYVYCSVYQMLASTVVIFTSILSIMFLKSSLWKLPHKILGILCIVTGSALVGATTLFFMKNSEDSRYPFLGIILVVSSEFLFGVQFIVEELFLKKYECDPLEVVGYEGFFCSSWLLVVLLVMYFIPKSDDSLMNEFIDSLPEAFQQSFHNPILMTCVLTVAINCGIFNLAGNALTKNLSAASKTTIDAIRNITIWLIQLLRGRQEFQCLQLLGFVIIVVGTFSYNEVGFHILCRKYNDWSNNIKTKSKSINSDKDNTKNITV